jgi:hypothetical protein
MKSFVTIALMSLALGLPPAARAQTVELVCTTDNHQNDRYVSVNLSESTVQTCYVHNGHPAKGENVAKAKITEDEVMWRDPSSPYVIEYRLDRNTMVLLQSRVNRWTCAKTSKGF